MKIIFIYLLSISYICSANLIHIQPIKFQSVFNRSVVIEEEHIIEKNENDIEITYPVILGLENSDKVNDLIKSHIYGIVENHKRTIYESYDVLLFLEYEIGFMNDRFISICYKGWWGALGSGRGWPLRVYTINIDLEEEKLVSKSDMVENTSKIFDLLMEGEFEFSGGIEATPFDWDNLDRFEDETLKYYIEEDRFCLTLSGTHSYGIYSIDIDRIKQYLNKDIVEKLYVYPMEDSVLSRDSLVIVDQYIIKREGNNVCVKYPMILGLENTETVNSLIKTHISEVVERRSRIIRNQYNYEMHYQYEIEFFNEKFLSIRYEGWWGAEDVGIQRTSRTHTINIDIEEGKVVSKADMVRDSDRVFEMLMENQFESVQLEGKKIKPYYSPGDFIRQAEGLAGSHLDYYIKGDKFIITRQETYDFTEYAIRISEIKEYLNEDMVRKLAQFPEKRDSAEGQAGADSYVEKAKDLSERKKDIPISKCGNNTGTRDVKTIVIEADHIIEKNGNDIKITYPVILGLENSDKINDLIKSHIYGIVEEHKHTISKAYDVFLVLEYEINFLNDRFVSIGYRGFWSALGSGEGRPSQIYTINIDLEEEKLVSKSDMVENKSEIFKLLIDGKFKFSGGIDAEPEEWDRLDGFEDANLDYYIDEDRFFFTLSNVRRYGIYSINIDQIKEYLNKDIVEKLHVYPVEDSLADYDSPIFADQYIIEKEGKDVCVKYPMILGLENAETVNRLIKAHISEVVERRSRIIWNSYYYEMHYEYEVEFFNEKFLSIRYEGWWGAEEVGIHRSERTHTINIDIEEEKVVSKADMVKNSGQVFEMLMENKFESIPLNGKEARPYYSPGDFIRQKEGLAGSHLDYYIKGDKFIITRQETYDVTEYAIRISEIKEYLNEDMVRKLSEFPEK